MFGDKLRELMVERSLTMADVARMIGVSWQTVHNWLDGRCGPQWDTVVYLARALDVSTEVFCYDVALPDVPVVRKRGRPRKDNAGQAT